MNIAILGWYNYNNTGDESYKEAFPLLFKDHSLTFINKTEGFDFSNTDLLILGGGDIVKTTFTKQIPKEIRTVAASVTLTRDSDLAGLDRFEKVIVRDIMSWELGRQYADNVSFAPDFSFVLTADPFRGRKLIEKKYEEANAELSHEVTHKLTQKVVCVTLNSYMHYNNDDSMHRDTIAFDKLIHELARISESMDSSWIFLPFSRRSPWDDRSPCAVLAERCKKKFRKNLMIYDRLTPQDTLDIISACDASISTRLHSTIFSVIGETPFIDILHHDKNYGFVKTVGKTDWSTWLWDFQYKKVDSLLRDFLTSNNGKVETQAIRAKAREQLKDVSELILR